MNALPKSDAGLLSLLVKQIRFEAMGINSYELVAPNGDLLPAWEAGSHIDVHLPGGLIRQYSLCGHPADRSRYVIAVLRDEAGSGGSHLLHKTLQVAGIINVSLPRNNFALVPQADRYILLGGGIGITPLKAMAHHLAATNTPYRLYYCAKTPGHAAFREELGKSIDTVFHYDGANPANSFDLAALLKDHQSGTHVYYCGPSGFMAACAAATAHWPKQAVHSEHFKAPATPPSLDRATATEGAFDVRIASTGRIFTIPCDYSLVDALGEAGIEIETSCVSGLCGMCKVKYLSGEVEHRDYILADDERAEYLTACVSRGMNGTLVLDL